MQKKMSCLNFNKKLMASFFIVISLSSLTLAEGPAPSVIKDIKLPTVDKNLTSDKDLRVSSNMSLLPSSSSNFVSSEEFKVTDSDGIEIFFDQDHENRKNQIEQFQKNDYKKKTLPDFIVHREVTKENSHIPSVYFLSYYVKLAFQAINENNINKLRSFVNHYKLQSIQDSEGDSLLIRAVMLKRIEIARMLIMKNSHINISNKQNKTALHYAVHNEDYNMIKLLLSMGADPNLKDNKGISSLDYAKLSNNSIIKKIVNSYSR